MIHVTNENLDLHIRTESRGHWSAVTLASLRFESDILEVYKNKTILINGNETILDSLEGMYPIDIDTYGVTVTMSGSQFIKFIYFYDSILVRIDGHGSDFYNSQGMAGTWNRLGLIGRNGTTTFTNTTQYAVEWEVNPSLGDPVLFSSPTEHSCNEKPINEPPTPSAAELESAEEACDSIASDDDREACIFDVLITGDINVTQNPDYTDPFNGTERCISTPDDIDLSIFGGLSCIEYGGECVFRCDSTKFDCVQGAFCSLNIEDSISADSRRQKRRMNVIEGCSCAFPKAPSSIPSTSPSASFSPSFNPSDKPSKLPSSTPIATPPTSSPTNSLTSSPTSSPTNLPTSFPTPVPTSAPTSLPTSAPTESGGISLPVSIFD